MKSPKVSVLMPVYNGEKYLNESIESILKQNFQDFEFIIINDGSIDNSGKIISSFSDPRIRFIDNKNNHGLVNSLNEGLELAKGAYIARMDCDDVSAENGLSVQVAFMNKNDKVGLVGSNYCIVENGKKYYVRLPQTNDEINCYLLFSSALAHPTFFIRNKILQDNNIRYSNEFLYAEDYHLLTCMAEYAQLSNVSKLLMFYRIHKEQITADPVKAIKKENSVLKIHRQKLNSFGKEPTENDLKIHKLISDGKKPDSIEQFKEVENWLILLLQINSSAKKLNHSYFQKIILEKWLRICYQNYGTVSGLKYFYKSSLYHEIKLPFQLKKDFILNLYYSFLRSSYFR